MKPKILFVCYDGFRTTNARVRCYRFSSELKKYGTDSAVFSFKDDLHASYDGEDSYRVGFLERLSLLVRASSRLLREDKSTVFYVQKAGYFCLAPLLVHFTKGNRLITDYDDYEYEQSVLSRPLLRMLACNSIFCVAASHYLQEFLRQFNKKVYYIPTGVDMDIFKRKKSYKSRRATLFTWTGIIVDKSALQNLIFIVNCFENLLVRNKSIKLEIIGGGHYMPQVAKKISALNTNRIRYLGRLAPDEVPGYLSSVDVGLFALTKDSKYNQSKSPTKLFEYMAENLAVITTDIGESRYIIEHGYNGLIATNKEEFINCAILIAERRRFREKLGRNAYLTVKESYSLDILCKRLSRIIKQECGRKDG